jgi:hypothetical protein
MPTLTDTQEAGRKLQVIAGLLEQLLPCVNSLIDYAVPLTARKDCPIEVVEAESCRQLSLFKYGEFKLHSGEETWFKIDCDALDDEDLRVLALLIYENVGTFGRVEGVPTGGTRLADALRQYANYASEKLVIVDDVCTTGASMEEQRAGRDAYGYVIFCRGACPKWVTPIFRMTS